MFHLPFIRRYLIGLFVASLLASFVRGDTAELILTSQPGDFIGQGQTKDIIYTPANSTNFHASVTQQVGGQPSFLDFVMGTSTGSNATNTFSTLDFSTTQLGIPFQIGTYGLPGNTAQRADFAAPGHAGLDVTFQNRGSNTLSGNFTVNWVQFFKDSSNNFQIGALDVTFEQHSEGAAPALFGHFTFLHDGFSLAVPETGSSIALLMLALMVLYGARLSIAKSSGS